MCEVNEIAVLCMRGFLVHVCWFCSQSCWRYLSAKTRTQAVYSRCMADSAKANRRDPKQRISSREASHNRGFNVGRATNSGESCCAALHSSVGKLNYLTWKNKKSVGLVSWEEQKSFRFKKKKKKMARRLKPVTDFSHLLFDLHLFTSVINP